MVSDFWFSSIAPFERSHVLTSSQGPKSRAHLQAMLLTELVLSLLGSGNPDVPSP